ncbi:MobF family relaxase [Streptomyces erythrochromogenes]|uniref:MobF family relaxase n=1 Tax=Streptomyces erythrochromogenes TaxID=285574 RepID=UPI002F91B484|nr:relaxase domain-containing protein [Streptomyces erythrochromogenes]WSR88913.1 relaxase domain-containing protein [Streptomyces erythrochromogenes]
MAWLTKIGTDEQVEYRLKERAGCDLVVEEQADLAEQQAGAGEELDRAVAYRTRQEGETPLVWMGSGLEAVGLSAGQVLDEDGKAAARRLMNGCHPLTGARLFKARNSSRAHPESKLTVARVTAAIAAAAAEKGVEPAELLAGKPKQQRLLAQQQRMVHRRGEGHRLQIATLSKLAGAAGVDITEVFSEAELAKARAHQDERVDTRVRGFDLVLDIPKSDSVLAGLLPDHAERAYRDLVHEASRDALAQYEKWIGYSVGGEDGEMVRLATGGLLAWSTEHRSARPVGDGTPGDPHLHLHISIANMGLCEDGQWRSIAARGKDMHRHASAIDGFFKARLRALTYEKFGVVREQAEKTRAWEVAGIPAEVRDRYSRRAKKVVEVAGEGASREEMARASAATRRAKHATGAAEMRESWRERAESMGVDVEAMLAAAAPGPPGPDGGAGIDGPGGGPLVPPPWYIAAVVFDPETGVTATRKDFDRAQLLAAVANALPYGIGADVGDLDRLVDDVLRVEGYAVALPHLGSTVMSATDRYTTRDVLDAEAVAITQAKARYADASAVLTADQAEAALSVFEVAAGFALSEEQRRVVMRLLTAGHGVDAVIGVAGAGKSTLMDACRIAWDATGTTYAGACLSAVGAKGLQDASAIPSRTVASWLLQIETGTGLTGIDVLVLDEAAMTDDRAAAKLLTEAARTGTKLVAIGDPKQLQSVGVGGWFAEVHRMVDGEVLTENRRQENEAERQALEVWRTGDHQAAIELLAAGGRVHATGTAAEARSQMLMAWDELRQQWPDELDLLENLVVLAARNIDVDALNLGAQQIRRSLGELGTAHTYALPGAGELTLAEGDIVRVRANDYRSRHGKGPDVLNGYRAVITAVSEDRRVEITWRTKERLPDGTVKTESAWMSPGDIAAGQLSLGYAMTVAASQGLTCHTSLLYGHGANAFAAYPGLTRARKANHVWLPLEVMEDEHTKELLGDARTETEELQRAIQAFARYLGQSRPDSMISDELRAAPEPVTAPIPHQVQQEQARADAEAALQEARQRVSSRAARMKSTSTETSLRERAEAEARRNGAGQQEPAAIDERQAQEPEIPSWSERPYGRRGDNELARNVASFLGQAEQYEAKSKKALAEHEALRVLLDRERAEGATRGTRWAQEAGTVLDTALAHLTTALQEAGQAHQANEQAQQARKILPDITKQLESSWLALRLAGSSKKEVQELRDHYLGRAIGGEDEAMRARRASDDARRAAWEALKSSPFAESLGATGFAPQLDELPQKLAAMRQVLPEQAQVRDIRDQNELGQLHGTAQAAAKEAVNWRGHAALALAEQQRRQLLAEKHPTIHKAEALARKIAAEANQRQKAAAPRPAASRAAAVTPPQRRGPRAKY